MKHDAVGSTRRTGEWTFCATMSLVVAGVVAWRFGPSYTRSLAPPGLPFWVHLHGAVMTAWILLFAVQAALVRRRALPLHRTLGLASIGLVAVMVPLGMATNLLAIRRDACRLSSRQRSSSPPICATCSCSLASTPGPCCGGTSA